MQASFFKVILFFTNTDFSCKMFLENGPMKGRMSTAAEKLVNVSRASPWLDIIKHLKSICYLKNLYGFKKKFLERCLTVSP